MGVLSPVCSGKVCYIYNIHGLPNCNWTCNGRAKSKVVNINEIREKLKKIWLESIPSVP